MGPLLKETFGVEDSRWAEGGWWRRLVSHARNSLTLSTSFVGFHFHRFKLKKMRHILNFDLLQKVFHLLQKGFDLTMRRGEAVGKLDEGLANQKQMLATQAKMMSGPARVGRSDRYVPAMCRTALN